MSRVHAHRSQSWWFSLTPEQKAAYLKKFPGTMFHTAPKLVVPNPVTGTIEAKARLITSKRISESHTG